MLSVQMYNNNQLKAARTLVRYFS